MKFKLVEKINLTREDRQKYLNQVIDEFHSLNENEIIDLINIGIINNISTNAPMFISPNGTLIDVAKVTGMSVTTHADMIEDILNYITSEINPSITLDDISVKENIEDISEDELENLVNKGWIRINTGTSTIEKRFYCVLPYRDAIKPTERQYNILKEFIEYGQEKNKKELLIYFGDSAKWYNLQNEEAQDIIKEIKRYYAGFNESLNEVYPNKGESKKDFIARFMSVTKDEYPDIKQRFAVSLQYWDRKDKKK